MICVCFDNRLSQLLKEKMNAQHSGNPERTRQAERTYDDYKAKCAKADAVVSCSSSTTSVFEAWRG